MIDDSPRAALSYAPAWSTCTSTSLTINKRTASKKASRTNRTRRVKVGPIQLFRLG